jgi:hypothetical protein
MFAFHRGEAMKKSSPTLVLNLCFFALIAIFGALLSPSQKAPADEQTFIKLQHDWAEARKNADMHFLESFYVYSHIVPGDTTDLIPLTRKTYSGPLEVGEDLMTIEIGDRVVVHRSPR